MKKTEDYFDDLHSESKKYKQRLKYLAELPGYVKR